jgi:hypothetical protein
MATGNDGVMSAGNLSLLVYEPQEGEDQKYFPLGKSKAKPAASYKRDSKKSVKRLLAEREQRHRGW